MKRFLTSESGSSPSHAGPSPTKPEAPQSWFKRLMALVESEPLINGIVALAFTVGFLHGWLKIRFPHPLTTFAFDGLLALALGLVILQSPRGTPLLPPGRISGALKAFYVLCAVYLILPFGPPVLVSLAAARGWCFATLMFVLGYRLTKSIPQVKGYFYVVMTLAILTALYGLQQSPEEIAAQMKEDPLFAERYKFTYYATPEGRELRIFSTFVSAGAFGGTLAYAAIFGMVLLSDSTMPKRQRWIILLALLPMTVALLKSGSRTAFISLFFGFAILAWYRRNFQNLILVPLCALLALKVTADLTGGILLERFGAVLNFESIYLRNVIPTSIGWDYITDGHWFGGGLGRTGYSVPFFLQQQNEFSDYVMADGDLGRLMIDFGILGLLVFGWLLWVVLKDTWRAIQRLRDTPAEGIGLACASCFIMSLATFPSGSPFLGIPMGVMTWFFLGTLHKLEEENRLGHWKTSAPRPQPQPAKRFNFHRPLPAEQGPSGT